jgi:hypothetical protein
VPARLDCGTAWNEQALHQLGGLAVLRLLEVRVRG